MMIIFDGDRDYIFWLYMLVTMIINNDHIWWWPWLCLIIIYYGDHDYKWWSHLMVTVIIYDDNIWWWPWLYLTIIYDAHIWWLPWLYMMIIFDGDHDYKWWSYLMVTVIIFYDYLWWRPWLALTVPLPWGRGAPSTNNNFHTFRAKSSCHSKVHLVQKNKKVCNFCNCKESACILPIYPK